MIMFCAMAVNALAQTDFRPITFEEAVKAAKSENKMVFIDFYTDWCGPCKMMARDVFPQKKVGEYFNKNFVCIKLNAEKEGKELAKRFEVKAYPTFLVLNTKEEVVLDIKGSMDADTFIAKVVDGLNPDMTPARMEERYNSGERTPELINAYAMHLMQQHKEEEGFKVINDYYASLSDAQRVDDVNLFLYTRYTLDLKDEKAAYMIAHRNEFSAASQPVIMERIGRLYHSVISAYFSGYMLRENKYVEADYQKVKKEMLDLGLDADGKYTPMFKLIECRVNADDAAFLAACEQEFDALSEQGKNLLVINLNRLIETQDKAILQGMSRFIRSRLAGVSPSVISLSGRVLEGIEAKLKE